MRFLEPLDGAMRLFTDADLARRPATVHCRVEAAPGRMMEIGGVPARDADGVYLADVPLTAFRNEITAADPASGERASLNVYRLTAPRKVYRLSLDDNIWFLQDIAAKRYASIFDNPYLAMYRDFHEKYGTKVHANIYLTCPEHGGFHLSQMPDRYLHEWQDARDWLHLTAHARADQPDMPYAAAGYDRVYGDFSAVMAEIRRFAGEPGAVTTMHWAEATAGGIRALRDLGIQALLGDFSLDERGEPAICYSATKAQYDEVRTSCFWRDPGSGMIYFPCDIVLNSHAPGEIDGVLDGMAARWPDRNFIDILIHEQYFYPDYVHYLPDYRARVERGIRWCRRNGYEPGFVSDLIDFTASF